MTTDQLVGLIRQLLPFLGGMLMAHGFSQEDSQSIIGKTGEVIGPLMTIGGMIWAYFANSKKSILTSASNMPEVASVQLTPANKELADKLPQNVVVRGQRNGD